MIGELGGFVGRVLEMSSVKDLVEEAKKRIVLLLVCVFGLSYLMSCKWCFFGEFEFLGVDWKFHCFLHVFDLGFFSCI